MADTKICKKCGRELPITEFSKGNKAKDGLQPWCKHCYKQWRESNPKYMKQYMNQYFDTLRGHCIRIRNSNILEDRKYERIGEELPNNYPTVEDYMELLLLPDFYDGKQYDFTDMGLDRIYNDKPHTLDNVVPCSTANNRKRGRMPFEEFKALFT